ncbi:hypothetical protein CYMTET_41389 [Cymbomonas tetramitiformis]|uniref:Uncharacterized protein n=1 Tax=Cymbomonas tetramitiformis TaxID=36881 RepID=A0AAE0F202_9CHLO|nr:hypothetical protein CYMTET_41389 [Cymbomonas tetramitiformis]
MSSSGECTKRIFAWEDFLTFELSDVINSLRKHEWINIMSMLHAFAASLDIWLVASSLISVYTCFHKDYNYLEGHVLWVATPCNETAKDFGFVFAMASVFAVYNIITSLTQVNLLTHYGVCHEEKSVYVMSGVVTVNLTLATIGTAQHLSMIYAYHTDLWLKRVVVAGYIIEVLANLILANVRPYGAALFYILMITTVTFALANASLSAIAISQFYAPKNGQEGHADYLCAIFGDDELNEDQYGDIVMFFYLGTIRFPLSIVVSVCVLIIRTNELVGANESVGLRAPSNFEELQDVNVKAKPYGQYTLDLRDDTRQQYSTPVANVRNVRSRGKNIRT